VDVERPHISSAISHLRLREFSLDVGCRLDSVILVLVGL